MNKGFGKALVLSLAMAGGMSILDEARAQSALLSIPIVSDLFKEVIDRIKVLEKKGINIYCSDLKPLEGRVERLAGAYSKLGEQAAALHPGTPAYELKHREILQMFQVLRINHKSVLADSNPERFSFVKGLACSDEKQSLNAKRKDLVDLYKGINELMDKHGWPQSQ